MAMTLRHYQPEKMALRLLTKIIPGAQLPQSPRAVGSAGCSHWACCCGGANKFMCEIRRFTAIGLADAFLRAVARAIADFASRSANSGKTKRRIMKTTLLLTAVQIASAQGTDIAVNTQREPALNK